MSAPKNNKNRRTHGLAHTRIDNIYRGMVARCYKPSNNRFHVYGGRGIKVCDEWLQNKEKFFEWAFENGYSPELTLDRINVDEGYCPENCRWATCKEQNNNRKNNILISMNGVKHTLSEWADITGIKRKTLWRRYSVGDSPEMILRPLNRGECA